MGFLPSADETVITLKTKNLVGEREMESQTGQPKRERDRKLTHKKK